MTPRALSTAVLPGAADLIGGNDEGERQSGQPKHRRQDKALGGGNHPQLASDRTRRSTFLPRRPDHVEAGIRVLVRGIPGSAVFVTSKEAGEVV